MSTTTPTEAASVIDETAAMRRVAATVEKLDPSTSEVPE